MAFYEALRSWPAKLIAAFGWLIPVLFLPEEIRRWFGISWENGDLYFWSTVCLAVTTTYFWLLWILKPQTIQIEDAKRSKNDTALSAEPNLGSKQAVDRLRRTRVNPGVNDPDLPLVGVLGRVYKKLGGAPDTGNTFAPRAKAMKEEFYDKVDRELADRVHLNGMTLWGRYKNTPLRQIVNTNRISFDHRSKTATIPGDAIQSMRFTDIMFNKAEVDRVWPQAPTQENANG